MLDLQIFNKVATVEKETGHTLPEILGKVPFGTVVTAFKVIPVNILVDMVKSVPIEKLVTGLTLITPKQIVEIPYDKLAIVLKEGNMETVDKLQQKYSEGTIIFTLNKMSKYEIKKLLSEDNFENIVLAIDEKNGIINM